MLYFDIYKTTNCVVSKNKKGLTATISPIILQRNIHFLTSAFPVLVSLLYE